MKKVTVAEGKGGSKILHLRGDEAFEWLQTNVLQTLLSMGWNNIFLRVECHRPHRKYRRIILI